MGERQNDRANHLVSAENSRLESVRSRNAFGTPVGSLFWPCDAISIGESDRNIFSSFVCKWLVLRHRFWTVVSGADIPLNCRIGGGLLIPHPNGIVIHPDAEIGVNCLIFQQVTIGTRDEAGVPAIAGHVDIGAGSQASGVISCRLSCQDRRERGCFERCAKRERGGWNTRKNKAADRASR